ncbi:MAG: spore coat protein [Nevskiaceae bacterium]|nr:MAG: spore coat protein [Nevskiaceae bacterium]
MKVLCILQARTSSTRLPGKVLKPILGRPMLFRQIERIKRAKRVTGLVVATSIEPSDDAIAELCRGEGIDCFRGDLNDVLGRYYHAAVQYKPEHILRLTGDCPLSDPEIIDQLVELHQAQANDYTSNVIERTYPNGLDAEIFTFEALARAFRSAQSDYEREHVTPYLYAEKSPFRKGVLKGKLDWSKLRWTVDYAADFDFVTKVYETLYPSNPTFSTSDVLALLQRQPAIGAINEAHAAS